MAEASPSVDAPAEVIVREWRTIDPSTTPALVGRYLDTPALRAQAEALRSRKALDVREVRAGLSIRAWQHVGVVQLGALRVVVRPKVSTDQLWRMIAYGLGIDGLPLDPPAAYALDGDFVDLLAAMLAHEAEGLWAGGLSSGYVERSAWLGSPRGRVDFAELARSTPLRHAALPCRHHAYTTDTLENRVVLAALVAARRGVRAPRLGRRLHQLAETYRTSCTEVHLDRDLLDRADRGRTRLTARYTRAHRLARAIASGLGPDERLRAGATELFGALWNMALLFERVVVRWLTETAPEGVRVASQVRLNGVF